MTIEFIGIAGTAPHSETEIAPHQASPDQAGPAQPGYLEELARAHEDAGFDRRRCRPARPPGCRILRCPTRNRRPRTPGFLAWNALGLAALYLGVAAAARDWLVGFLDERTPARSAGRWPRCRASRPRSGRSRPP
jgi:hypothetical protein